eukprot:5284784-Karenia_brevis.AAC.1
MEVVEPEDENGEEDDEEGVEGERLKLSEDSEHMKKILDPSLPAEQEIEEHYEMGHAQGLESGIVGGMMEKRGSYQTMSATIVSLEMRWGISGRCWWAKRGKLGPSWQLQYHKKE